MLLEAREHEKKYVIPYLSNMFLETMEVLPHCYTMVNDGRIVTCMGIIPLWEGVWEVWQIPSVYIAKYMLSYCKAMKYQMDSAGGRINVRRIQSVCPADELHDRWMRFIGFDCEGTFKEYSRFGKDCRMWARRYHGR